MLARFNKRECKNVLKVEGVQGLKVHYDSSNRLVYTAESVRDGVYVTGDVYLPSAISAKSQVVQSLLKIAIEKNIESKVPEAVIDAIKQATPSTPPRKINLISKEYGMGEKIYAVKPQMKKGKTTKTTQN